MLLQEENANSIQNGENVFYIEKRRDLVNLMRNVNTKLDFNSQTFFLCVTYMDEIFKGYYDQGNMSDYVLLSLSCLFVAAKFNENDPRIPDIYKFNNVLSNLTKYKFIFTVDDVRNGEVAVLKMLQYKLNRFSIYHFIVFFFAHGIFFDETYERSESKGLGKKKCLEKIYILSRELLDYVTEDENDFEYANGKYPYIWAVIILTKAIESILSIKIENKENVFTLIYHIDLYENKDISDISNEIQSRVDRIYDTKVNKRKIQTATKSQKVNIVTPPKISVSPMTKTDSSVSSASNINYIPNNRMYQHINVVRVAKTSNNSAYQEQNFTRIKSDFSSARKDIFHFAMRKRACSSNKDNTSNVANSPSNTTHIDESHYDYNQSTTNTNEMLYQKYITKRPINKNIPPHSEQVLYQDDILDKTKKIFDNAKKDSIDTSPYENNLIHQRNKNNLYSNYSEIYGNTIIINNNININTYIDRKDPLEVNNIRKVKNDSKYVNTNESGRRGHFGTYYDYGYDQYLKNNNNYYSYKGGRSISGLNASTMKYGAYGTKY